MKAVLNNPMPSPFFHRKFLIRNYLLSTVLAASFVTSNVNADPSRFKVTGKADPTTGYRIDYTVSSRFQQEDMLKRLKGGEKQYLEFMRFLPPSAGSSADQNNGDPSDPSSKSKSHEPPKLSFSEATLISGYSEGTIIDKQGYITVDNSHKQFGNTVYQQRIIVSGFPATWSAYEDPGKKDDASAERYYLLLIKLPGKPRVYQFVGIAEGKQEADEVQAELTAIRDSIHIVKVK